MPSADEDGEVGPLLALLRARITRDGPMPVDDYIRACVADPEHGYWQRAETIGTGGDFITSPEISQVFGELLGLWCAVTWQGMGSPNPLRLIELGPGRGTLMRDMLRAARAVPAFLAAARVYLIETSASLREVQKSTLASSPRRRGSAQLSTAFPPGVVDPRLRGDDVPIEWHRALEEVPEGAAIVIANEFLDALLIRQLVFDGAVWRERVVAVDETGGLRFGLGAEADVESETTGASPAPGAILELRAGEDELLARLAERKQPLVALFIDYGPAEWAVGDTLQAVRRHAWVDPLATPGLADLTAHVQFARLAQKARAAGLAVDGPMTQAEFLGRLGINERAARLMAANPQEAAGIEAGVQRLVSPTGMGGLFKVLAVRTPSLPPTVPFA
jgi:NADH dehydrogenase [ubiquinone] 1 alpha subcomplex assembly factor 7